MIREAILYVNNVIDLASGTYKSPERNTSASSSLPELDITCEEKKPHLVTSKNPPRNKLPPMPPPSVTSVVFTPSKSMKPPAKAKVAKSLSTQSKTRTKSTGRKPVKAELDSACSSQSSGMSQLPGRSQSVRKQKKNNKGELPIHLAVMNVMKRRSV